MIKLIKRWIKDRSFGRNLQNSKKNMFNNPAWFMNGNNLSTVKNTFTQKITTSTIGKIFYEENSTRFSWKAETHYQDWQPNIFGYSVIALLLFTGSLLIVLGVCQNPESISNRLVFGADILTPYVNQLWSVIEGAALLVTGIVAGCLGSASYFFHTAKSTYKNKKRTKVKNAVEMEVTKNTSRITDILGHMFDSIPYDYQWVERNMDKIMDTLSFGMEKENFVKWDDDFDEFFISRGERFKIFNKKRTVSMAQKALDEHALFCDKYTKKLEDLVTIWCSSLQLDPARFGWKLFESDQVLETINMLGMMAGTDIMIKSYYEGVPIEDICN